MGFHRESRLPPGPSKDIIQSVKEEVEENGVLLEPSKGTV